MKNWKEKIRKKKIYYLEVILSKTILKIWRRTIRKKTIRTTLTKNYNLTRTKTTTRIGCYLKEKKDCYWNAKIRYCLIGTIETMTKTILKKEKIYCY